MKKSLAPRDKFAIAQRIVTILAVWIFAHSPASFAQGSRKDDIVFGPAGHPVSGATVRICQPAATGTPCSPLATIYTDATLSVSSANPFQTDGIGNYHFYAPAGRYMIQISGPNITGTITQPDVILPADLSSTTSGNNISAFGLTLGGNLSVTGNTNITGTLTTSNFSPGSFSPSSLNVEGSATIQGPRPWIDVTSYGAKGNATGTFGSDDTVPIQNAINAACATSTTAGTVPIVYFPPGVYFVSQPQLPSTLPVFLLPCSVELVGSGFSPTYSGFPVAAHGSVLQVQNYGSNPNLAAVFDVLFPYNGYSGYPSGTYGGNFVSYNLTIAGDNQALYVTGSQQAILRDTCLVSFGTGTDATPLKITDTFEFYMDGGCLDAPPGGGHPVGLFTGENQPGGPSAVGTAYFRNVVTTNGQFVYDQRTPSTGVPPGNFTFENVLQEASYGSFMKLTCSGGQVYNFNGLYFNSAQQADNSVANSYLVDVNCPSMDLTGLHINLSNAGNAGQGGAAVISGAGAIISGYETDDCETSCDGAVVNSSGLPVGSGMQQGYAGNRDTVWNTSDALRLRTDFVGATVSSDSPGQRWFSSGSGFASLGIDPALGFLFNDGTSFGFNASVNETTTGQMNINFASQLPPTNLAGTAASSGSVATGTYTAVIRTTSNNCSAQSAPSAQSAAVTLAGSNHTINWTWTAPTNYVGTNNGYCLTLGSAYNNEYVYISGASTTSYSMTTAPSAGGTNSLVNALQAQHVITPSTFGINTTSPGPFALDVQALSSVAGARFGNTATPTVANSYGAPGCLAAVACSSFIPISPVAVDTFSRATSSTLGANWLVNNASGMGALGINGSGYAVTSSSSYTSLGSWINTAQAFGPDQFAQVAIPSGISSNQDVGVSVRNSTTANTNTEYTFQCYNLSGAHRAILKYVAGSSTSLLTTSNFACSGGDTIRIEVVGTQISAFYNGVLDGTVSDSSIASGQPGIMIYASGTSPTASNFVGGNLEGNESTTIFNRPNFWAQAQSFSSIGTLANCSSSASPAVCGSAAAGSVAIAASATTEVVNSTAVTANSQIHVTFDESLGAKLGVTCNSASGSESATYFVSARMAGTSFTVKTSAAPATNPACLSYSVQN